MLKLFLCILGTFSIVVAFTVDVKRTYFYNDPSDINYFIKSVNLPGHGEDKTSNDLKIRWAQSLQYINRLLLKTIVTFDYNGKYPTEVATFYEYEFFDSATVNNLGQSFFDRIMAKNVRTSNQMVNKGVTTVPGHLEWNRNYAKGVHCEVPVTITLVLQTKEAQKDVNIYRETTKAVYKGQFITGKDYCPK